ncbi:MAG: cofactor-independent phosphoglycerate mutase [Fibrobacter sp.]|nr:cofactor-independent phosphoglycerate mutase [Fibrobacter sp.]
MEMKYAILVGDGMADFPLKELGNRTPLEYAVTENMDHIVSEGRIGLVSTIPEGLKPGSDVANLSLMGYDPAQYYSGRAPIEAASMGVELSSNDTAFRCNLVTIENGRMVDYSAGHIETEDARRIISELDEKLRTDKVRFYPGVSYRHLLVVSGFPEGLNCTPPHDITDKEIAPFIPEGPGAEEILILMNSAREILKSSKVNAERKVSGKRPVTDIWLWGQGRAIKLPQLRDKYGISGSVISAVDLVKGLGALAGLRIRSIPGATGYLGTNYAGKVAAAAEALKNEDLIYLHVEAPDETSHEGSLQKKIQAIEEFDRNVVGEMVRYQKDRGDLRLLVAPDHATPVSLKTHTAGPVPYGMCGPGIEAGRVRKYTENDALGSQLLTGTGLFELFIKG